MTEAAPGIQIISTDDKIHIEWNMTILYNDKENGGYSCFIPGWGIRYFAKSEEMIEVKAKAFTKFFFDHYLLDRKNQTIGFKRLMIDLNKKGFRDEKRHTEIMYRSMKDLPFKSSLKSLVEEGIDGYSSTRTSQSELEAALY